LLGKVNPSTPQPEGQGLLRVDPEPRFLTPSLKMGLGAAERVNRTISKFSGKKWEMLKALQKNILSNK
jgi:hypothetical protein